MRAGARRWSGRQKGWPARQRNSSLLVSARQLQAHVRQRADHQIPQPTTVSRTQLPDCLTARHEQAPPYKARATVGSAANLLATLTTAVSPSIRGGYGRRYAKCPACAATLIS